MNVVDVGWKALAALERSRGEARVLAPLHGSTYLLAGEEVVWLGPRGACRHPRAVLVASPGDVPVDANGSARLDVRGVPGWRGDRPPCIPVARTAIVEGCRRLRLALGSVGVARGLSLLLARDAPVGPPAIEGELRARAEPQVRELATACAAGDAVRGLDAATALLGLGPGLTPSGDDFVGGLLFVRALLDAAHDGHDARWHRIAQSVVARARELTHPVSAALLADLADGEGLEPLHGLACALAADRPWPAVLDAARCLTRVGHSSGWDLLAGFVVGAG